MMRSLLERVQLEARKMGDAALAELDRAKPAASRARGPGKRPREELKPVGPLDPADNVELTDGSDSEVSKKRRKQAPEWCKNLAAVRELVAQQQSIDPDTIFGRAAPCDLAAIFGGSRRRARGSSGNW